MKYPQEDSVEISPEIPFPEPWEASKLQGGYCNHKTRVFLGILAGYNVTQCLTCGMIYLGVGIGVPIQAYLEEINKYYSERREEDV